MAIKIRRAKITDIPSLVEKANKFYNFLKDHGARDIAKEESVLRGGIVIELGSGFSNPNWYVAVAVKDEEVIAFSIGVLEYCSPISEYNKCVRIHADYQENDSLAGGRILLSMWGLIETWAKENGASYFYANVHPGNQPSVRGVKYLGFKHHYTQFYRPIELEKKEEVI